MCRSLVFTDFVVICGEIEEKTMIPCHKLFLATNSGYFARMLDSVWNEAQKGEVEIEEFQQEEVEALIKFSDLRMRRTPLVNLS